MKLTLNLSRPDVVFAMVWLMVLAVYVPFPTMITPSLGTGVSAMLLFNILTAPAIYCVIRKVIEKKLGTRYPISNPSVSSFDEKLITKFIYILMAVWVTIFVVNVAYSGGVPLVWYLTGDTREYADFGILSVSGFGDMFRCFAATLCILLFVTTHRRIYLLLWIAHLLPSIVQVTRGGLFIFICQNISIFLLLQKVRFRQVLIAGGVILFAMSMFILLGMLRGIAMKATDFAGVDQYFGGLPVGVYWVWSYVASPLGNVAYGASLGLRPSYVPDQTLVYLLPSVLRQTLFAGHAYTPLNVEYLNATSIYAPLVMDFGVGGATIAIAILQVIASYVHIKAQRGSVFYMLLYPSMFASLALSFFHIFALTPGVVAVPLLCIWFRKFLQKRYFMRQQSELHADAQNATS